MDLLSKIENEELIMSVKRLAVFGGQPEFSGMLHVGRPNVGDKEKLFERINDIIEQRWLTNDGPFVRQFEESVAEFCDVKHCIAVCNGTLGLELLVRALELKGEVIVPAFTFIATAHVLQWHGITPVFCDIDPATHNIDPSGIEELITDNTTGIIGVHLWGRPCDIPGLNEIAEKHSLKLIFDAAHAFGCALQGTPIGNFGEAEVISFHATKYVNAFEGGAVLTNNDELAEKLRLMRNFGFAGYDNVVGVGTNAKMPEIAAAMGITSLEAIEDFLAVNQSNYECYKENLRNIEGISIISYDSKNTYNYQYVVIEIDSDKFGITRDNLMKILHAENIFARRYFYPGCHKMEPYKTIYPNVGERLPVTEDIASRVLVLPTGTAVKRNDIEKICAVIRTVADNVDGIRLDDKQG